jgi:hypothetical protein
MTFSISFDEGAGLNDACLPGHIQLDHEAEYFNSVLTFWSRSDYERHWRKAAAQLLAGSPASFVVSIERRPRSYGERWVAWPQGTEQVIFQNWLILPHLQNVRYRVAGRSFDYDNPEAAPKSSVTETRVTWRRKRLPISTWTVAREDVLSWWEATSASGEAPAG